MSEAAPRTTPFFRNPAVWSALLGLAISAVLGWRVAHREAPLPVLGALPPVQLTDQAGKAFTLDRLKGHTTIVNFIFTTCPTVCPLLTDKMAGLQERIKEDGDALQLVSFSVDPEVDTPAVLTEFAAAHHADTRTWTFVTGKPDEVVTTISEGFKVAVGREKVGGDAGGPDGFALVHGEHFILVDHQARIRGYYHKDDADLDRLLADARRLARQGTP